MAALIYYNNEFHRQCPTTKPLTKHILLEGGTTIPVDKSEKCMFSLNDIVVYANDYWKIVDEFAPTPYKPTIKKIDGKDRVHYYIRLIVDFNTMDCKPENNRTECIPQFMLNKLNKAETSEISALANHVNRYNGMICKISYINTSLDENNLRVDSRVWHSGYSIEYPSQLLSLPYVLRIKKSTGLRDNKISELASIIKRNKDSSLQFRFICKTPFSFIREDWELFTFDRAYNISKFYGLTTCDDIKERAWIYSYVHEKNQFYIDKRTMAVDWRKNIMKIYKSPPRSMLSSGILKIQEIAGIEYYTTQFLIDFEENLGEKIFKLFNKTFSPYSISEIEMYINEFECEPDRFKMNQRQREAVIKSLTNHVCIITGCPGTGKSTIVECILYILCKKNAFKNISICAPTGLAYKNLIDKTGKIQMGDETFKLDDSASGTIHKVLFNDCPRIGRREKKKESAISDIQTYSGADKQQEKYKCMENIDLFIPDESSMIDTWMFDRLLNECEKFNSRLILVGDMNQLPSVGPGKVLKSIIDSGLFRKNTVILDKICRQESGALLNGICKMASGGIIDMDDFDEETLCFKEIESIKKSGSLDEAKVYEFIDAHNLTRENSKILCYNSSAKHPINTTNLNIILQHKYNPDGKIIQNMWANKISFRVGDRIMLTTNESQVDMVGVEHYRVNGDEAEILRVVEDGVVIKYLSSTTHCITINTLYLYYQLSYALSVHKSQGSQYENIIFMLDNIYNIDKRVAFTAISRATRRCIVLSNMPSFITVQQRVYDKPSLLLSDY